MLSNKEIFKYSLNNLTEAMDNNYEIDRIIIMKLTKK